MSSYVYMKFLESAPERYDAGIRRLSGGRIDHIYQRIAAQAASPGRRVLDVGCGTGGVSLACVAHGADVVGIDISADMLELARRKARAQTKPAGGSLELIELGAMEIEDQFPEASFDALVSCLVMSELLPEERHYLLATARSRLRPGGILVIADEVVPQTRWGRLRRTFARLPAAAWTYLLTQQSTHPVPDLAAQIAAAGFVEVHEQRLAHDDFAIVTAIRGDA